MLTDEQIQSAASQVGLEPAIIRAVIDVESSGRGFWNIAGKTVPVVNFEAQVFRRLTGGTFDASHPDLSFPSMDRKFGPGEWDRYQKALALDARAAMQATSFGLFQIMGFNFALCGFDSVEDFVAAMSKSEAEQLRAFLAFLQRRGLIPLLQKKDFKSFAKLYNGPQYALNHYDTRMETSYHKHGGAP